MMQFERPLRSPPNVNDVPFQLILDADLVVPTTAKHIPTPIARLPKLRLPANSTSITAENSHPTKHLVLGDTSMLRTQESQFAACR